MDFVTVSYLEQTFPGVATPAEWFQWVKAHSVTAQNIKENDLFTVLDHYRHNLPLMSRDEEDNLYANQRYLDEIPF